MSVGANPEAAGFAAGCATGAMLHLRAGSFIAGSVLELGVEFTSIREPGGEE